MMLVLRRGKEEVWLNGGYIFSSLLEAYPTPWWWMYIRPLYVWWVLAHHTKVLLG